MLFLINVLTLPAKDPPMSGQSDTETAAEATAEDKRYRLVEAAMRRNGYQPGALIETLHAVQEAFGYLDESSMRYVAEKLGLPLSKVFGVATFYHYFRLKPKGRHTCVVCMGTACYIKGADALLERIRDEFGIAPEETTPDAKLSLLTARCVGACGLAPAVVIDDDVAGHVTPDDITSQLKALS